MLKIKQQLNGLNPLNFIVLAVAGIINAFGVTLFLFPVKLYDSGVSGLSMLLDQITPAFLTLPFFLVAINFPVFLYHRQQFHLLIKSGGELLSF